MNGTLLKSLKCLALQHERDYILFRLRDLDQKEEAGFHPSAERRQLMNYFEVVNSEVQDLVRQLIKEQKHDADETPE